MMHCKLSKQHNKFLLPTPAKAIYECLCRAESEISNVVNYNRPERIPYVNSHLYNHSCTLYPAGG